MSFLRFSQAAVAIGAVLMAAVTLPAKAETLKVVHRFGTGYKTPSGAPFGSTPYSELLQASDGNFYGTTVLGGAGKCPSFASHNVQGCGTIFRMTPRGAITILYSFPFAVSANKAPDGAYPTAGLIQGKDGFLYGVASDGGFLGCNGQFGCGTLFRISTAGAFTVLHRFCSNYSCTGSDEGGGPLAHLVQTSSGRLCGTTSQGGFENQGTVFCASTTGGLSTLHDFQYENGTDGYDPVAALLVGKDGETLYGTTVGGGANGGGSGGGTVFALKGRTMTILHAFDNRESGAPGTYYLPEGALIFGADGKLYGTTNSGGSGGGCIFSLNTDGTGFAVNYDFNANASSNAPGFPAAGLVLARDGMMYGTTVFGSLEQTFGLDNGIAFRFDPVGGRFTRLADFNGAVGSFPRAALIEGADKFIYGTASAYGGNNPSGGPDAGTVVRLAAPLKD